MVKMLTKGMKLLSWFFVAFKNQTDFHKKRLPFLEALNAFADSFYPKYDLRILLLEV